MTEPARAAYLAAVPERDVLGTLVRAARLLGFLAYHTHDSRHSEAGFPDVILVGFGKVFALECKREGGRLTPAQKRWLGELGLAGVRVGVVRPSNLDETIRNLEATP